MMGSIDVVIVPFPGTVVPSGASVKGGAVLGIEGSVYSFIVLML